MRSENTELLPLRLSRERVLGIFAHPDDESLSTGGVFLHCKRNKIKTSVCILSKGERGKAVVKISREKLAEVRSNEVKKTCRFLGIKKLMLLDFPDLNFYNLRGQIRKDLGQIVRKENPSIVITHDPSGGSGHPDHITTSFIVYRTLKELAKQQHKISLYFSLESEGFATLFQVKNYGIISRYRPNPTHFFDISSSVEEKANLLKFYKSQISKKQRKLLARVYYFFDKELFHKVAFQKRYNYNFSLPFPYPLA